MIDVRARDRSGARNGLRFILRGLSVLLTLLFVTSCGNGIFIVGTPVVTLTTHRGHFTSYVVNIDSIEMTRRDGTIVELPTVNLRVDLAQVSSYVNLMETPALGEGYYVSATIVLDYTAPYVTIDAGGQAGPVNLIDAETGAAPTTETFTVYFDPNNPLTIGNQTSALVNFDIDLEASNTIAGNALPATVTVHPVVSVTSTPVYDKPVLTRGIFVFADTTNSNFVMNTRPLHDVVSNATYGALTVNTNAQTYWNIDGVTYSGAAGLAQLYSMRSETASLQIGAIGTGNPFGNLSGDTPSFTATQVYVGSSLESTVEDHIIGIVSGINSSANTITVMGAWLVDRLGNSGFSQAVPVTVAPTSTIVSVDGNASGSPNLSSISVGQFIDVSGVVTYLTDGSTNPASLDATAGQVRIQPTKLWANLNSTASGTANVGLDWVAHYEPTYIDFAGTGTSSSADATAGSYVINTGSLTVPTSPTGALFPGLLQIEGTANTFGAGPPYFTATSITDASALPQQLILEWSAGGSPNPFVAVNAGGLYVNLNDANLAPGAAGAVHVIRSGPQEVDVNTLTNPNSGQLWIQPSTATGSQFTVGNIVNGLYVFDDSTNFANRVLYNIGAVGPTTKLVATGQYNPSNGAFVATNIEITVQ